MTLWHLLVCVFGFTILVETSSLYSSSAGVRIRIPRKLEMVANPTLDKDKEISTVASTRRFSSSSGAVMDIKSVCLSIGNNDLISNINWEMMPKERWALVGPNGSGKSTLLKALTGTGGEMVSVREGDIAIARNKRLGYLEQKGVSGSEMTVREEVTSRMDRLSKAQIALDIATKALESGDTSEKSLNEFEDATNEFESAGGYVVEQKIANVLKGLGFVEDDYDRKCSDFSGGWQMRIALARLLLSEPDLLILDEPTNHLDKGAKNWLGEYLSHYDGTLLVVSHDLNLLQTAVNSIAEVRAGEVQLYKSRSHDQWQLERDERVKLQQAAFEKNQEEIMRLQSFVDRFGAKTMGASMAQSRLKTIAKLEAEGVKAPVLTDGPVPVLVIPKPPKGTPQTLLTMENINLAWSEEDANNDKYIVKNANFKIDKNMKIAVRGPNGAGKSTLMSALSGKLEPISGRRIEGDNLKLGIFTQDLAQDLDQKAKAVDLVTASVREFDPTLSDERARAVLGALGLRKEKATRLIENLSGGEKARVALAQFVLIPNNLLLLDEPSNHLDKETVSVLVKALNKFEGAVLVISHDKAFLEELEPTHVLTVREGNAILEQRSLVDSDWDDELDSRQQAEEKFIASATTAKINNDGLINEDVVGRKLRQNAPRKIKKVEAQITKYDEKMKFIDSEMLSNGRDLDKLKLLQSERDVIEAKSIRLLSEMEVLLEYI